MKKITHFTHDTRGKGRPQIVLVGNGLERESGQVSWDELVDILTVSDSIKLEKEDRDKIPFPLLYELLSAHDSASAQLSETDIREEEQRLAKAMGRLTHVSNKLLNKLPALGADHILTTNYSYCIEGAFFPKENFAKSRVQSKARFNLNPEKKEGKAVRQIYYRTHTGYLAKNSDGSEVGIWHIHGECNVPGGVVLGNDRYGRLLSRIERISSSQTYDRDAEAPRQKEFTSWPELFLYGDVYVIGFGFYLCESDLWWLLRRKQRERYADGRVYFYDNDQGKENEIRDLLLRAHGVIVNPGVEKEADFNAFYEKALTDIRGRIEENRQ